LHTKFAAVARLAEGQHSKTLEVNCHTGHHETASGVWIQKGKTLVSIFPFLKKSFALASPVCPHLNKPLLGRYYLAST
jgi:hypothetical protein